MKILPRTQFWNPILRKKAKTVPLTFLKTAKFKKLTVEYYNEKGEKIVEKATGLWARIFQHEIDHLNGVVYVDQMKDMKKLITLQEFKKRIVNKKKKK